MREFVKYELNKLGKDYVCGDIHGCFKELEKKMVEISFDKTKDRMFSVGDLTDRGPESLKAIDYIMEDWFIPVMGNHEDMILQCYRDLTAPAYWHMQNGGDWITKMTAEWIRLYVDEIEKLPLIIQVGEYGILHSRAPHGISWEELINDPSKFEQCILWDRDEINSFEVEGITGIFAGHTIHESPIVYGNLVDIDTGAFVPHWSGGKGKITIVEINDL